MNLVSPQIHATFQNFLAEALQSESFEIFQLAGDASSRRYFRVVAGEESSVLMVWEPFTDNHRYPFLSVLDHFAKHDVHVPRVLAKSPSQGLILLEDLGDLTLERKFWENQNQQLIIPAYQQAIDELIKIHYPASADETDCVAFKVAFDVDKLLWEMNYGREHLLAGLCGLRLTESQSKALDEVFLKVCTRLHEEPKFIAHRDYHSRNVMIKLGKMRVIDFQDARMGAVQYDLVSLLRDSYVRIDDGVARELLSYYLERRQEFEAPLQLPAISRDHFDEIYETQTIQRCFKACGSFASFFNLRQDTRYLKYIAHTLQTVRKSLGYFPEYKAFLDIMEGHGIFARKFDSP
ncbi:MAG: phosphotransferase [Bdellovibrionaceae bacterium]|nr:phosphotransferase [Pseudobdellovibrionaceae bacterium]